MDRLILIILVLWASQAVGQVTLREQVVPQVGDSLYFEIDTLATNVSVGPPGENLTWDFTSVRANQRTSIVYRPASAGQFASQFSNANAVIITALQETYLRLSRNRVEELGVANRGGFFGGSPIVYPSPATLFRTPYTYGFTGSYTTYNAFSISTAFLPDSLFAGQIRPDSLRFQLETTVEREADAWGTLALRAKTWNVIREKRISTPKIKIEAKLFGIWIDVTAIAGPIFGGFFGGLGPSTSYYFWSNETKGPILIANVDSAGSVVRVQYKPDARIFLSNKDALGELGRITYIADKQMLSIITGSLKSNLCAIEICDISGKLVQSSTMRLLPQVENYYALDRILPSGIYIVTVSNGFARSSKSISVP